MPLTSARAGSAAVSWERQSHTSRESLLNRIKYSNFEGIRWGDRGGGSTPVLPLLLPESIDETEVTVKLQVCPHRDSAGRLRCRYFTARVVVLVFLSSLNFFGYLSKTDKVDKSEAAVTLLSVGCQSKRSRTLTSAMLWDPWDFCSVHNCTTAQSLTTQGVLALIHSPAERAPAPAFGPTPMLWGTAASRHCFRLVSPCSSRGSLSYAVPQPKAGTPAALTKSQAHPCHSPLHLTASFSCNTALVGLAELFMAYPSRDLVLAAHTAHNTQFLPGGKGLFCFKSFALDHTRNAQIQPKEEETICMLYHPCFASPP